MILLKAVSSKITLCPTFISCVHLLFVTKKQQTLQNAERKCGITFEITEMEEDDLLIVDTDGKKET